jgi:hypothetical protein
MVRRDVMVRLSASERELVIACCASPAGESPVPVSIGAPGSRPQTVEGDLPVQAGCQKPVMWREPYGGKPIRGPQHQVKPAASTDLQPVGRADHLAAKATLPTRAPKLVGDCGGVGGAARVSGEGRNTRDPSARPLSWQGASYKPKAKADTVQRGSEGIVVPYNPERSGGRTPRRTTWREGGVPGVIEPMERVRVREWPA